MTLSPETRALKLANTILDRGMVPIISTECRALIASAIRQAEEATAQRIIASLEGPHGHLIPAALKALKSPIPKEPA